MSNQKTDSKPAPGSYAEFHATVLNQLERWDEGAEHQFNLASPLLRKSLADDIAGNLWCIVVEARAGSAPREGIYRELITMIQDLLPLLNTAEELGEWEALDTNRLIRNHQREKLVTAIEAARALVAKAEKEESR